MSSKPKPRVDRAVPVIRTLDRSDKAKVALTKALEQSMPASPDWAQSPGVQAALQVVSKGAQAIDANATVVVGLRTSLSDAMAKQRTLRRDWGASTKNLLGAVEVQCGGSVDKVTAFGLGVRNFGNVGLLAAPTNVVLVLGASAGSVKASWDKGNANHGFVVQHATDAANPTSYSVVAPNTKSKCTVTGLTPGSLVYFRVAAVDPRAPESQSPWSDWASTHAR